MPHEDEIPIEIRTIKFCEKVCGLTYCTVCYQSYSGNIFTKISVSTSRLITDPTLNSWSSRNQHWVFLSSIRWYTKAAYHLPGGTGMFCQCGAASTVYLQYHCGRKTHLCESAAISRPWAFKSIPMPVACIVFPVHGKEKWC